MVVDVTSLGETELGSSGFKYLVLVGGGIGLESLVVAKNKIIIIRYTEIIDTVKGG